jgi:hypothetical protein
VIGEKWEVCGARLACEAARSQMVGRGSDVPEGLNDLSLAIYCQVAANDGPVP